MDPEQLSGNPAKGAANGADNQRERTGRVFLAIGRLLAHIDELQGKICGLVRVPSRVVPPVPVR